MNETQLFCWCGAPADVNGEGKKYCTADAIHDQTPVPLRVQEAMRDERDDYEIRRDNEKKSLALLLTEFTVQDTQHRRHHMPDRTLDQLILRCAMGGDEITDVKLTRDGYLVVKVPSQGHFYYSLDSDGESFTLDQVL